MEEEDDLPVQEDKQRTKQFAEEEAKLEGDDLGIRLQR